tara:strand:+ start:2457 stop:4406 length:1950 start_codon:yes stop_codon:yes gene_type:complete
MAQQTIGIGSAANDGTGDPLRTAFNKINDNFTELYGTSAFGQQITLSGNKVSSNVTNANLVLEASGTGAIEFEGFQIRDNHIEGTRSNEDIRITANGTGNIFVGAIKLNGTTFSSDDSTLITFAEGVDVTGALTGTSASLSTTLAVTGTTTLTGATTVNNTLTANSVTTNAISSNGSNADISIQPSGTGDVVISALRVNGTTLDSSDSTSVTIAEAVDITGALTGTSGSFSTTLGVTGLTTLSGGATVLGTMTAGSVTTNAISSNGSNADISIQPSGTGDVVLSALRVNGTTLDSSDSTAINLAENVDVTGTLTTTDITTTGNIVVSGNIAPATLSIGDLNITADGSITSDSNGDIVIDPAGTGAIVLTGTVTHTGTQNTTGQLNVDNLRIDGNTISAPSSGGITLTPQAGSTVALGGIATATEFQATLGEFTTLRADKIENDTSNHALELGTQGTGPVKIGQTEISTTASTITGLVTNGDITITPQGTGAVTTANQLTLTGSFKQAIHTFTGDDAITEAEHAGRTLLLGEVGGNAQVTLTLPDATGSGTTYKFVVSVTNTSNYIIKVPDANNTIDGIITYLDLDGTAVTGYGTAATSDTITLNGTTTGGLLGDHLELIDIATDQWHVRGCMRVPTSSNPATPFSATVS